MAFTCQQPLAKKFRKYCFNIFFRQIRNHFVQLAIEAKDTALALVNDDLYESQHNVAIGSYAGFALILCQYTLV